MKTKLANGKTLLAAFALSEMLSGRFCDACFRLDVKASDTSGK